MLKEPVGFFFFDAVLNWRNQTILRLPLHSPK